MTGPRPDFHCTPAAGWMNDPHGVVHLAGAYHVFSQVVSHATSWQQDVSWGHAVGTDLVSLRHRPVALAPGDGDAGVWTGCVVVAPDGIRAFYTAVSAGRLGLARIRVARPRDARLERWEKGPVVVSPPEGVTAFRDPVVARRRGRWEMTVGAALDDGRAAALVWTSDDLETWSAAGIAASRESSAGDPWTGTLWECPQVVDLGDVHVLVTSVWADDVSYDTAWASGTWSDARFAAASWRALSSGGMHYAPTVFDDADGHPSMLFWLRGVGGPAVGWVGAHSVPYRIVLAAGVPRLVLHPELLAYAREPVPDGHVTGTAAVLHWAPTGRDALDVRSDVPLCSLRTDPAAGTLTLSARGVEHAMPWSGGEVDVVVDGPVVEVVSADGVTGTMIPLHDASFTCTARGPLEVRPLSR